MGKHKIVCQDGDGKNPRLKKGRAKKPKFSDRRALGLALGGGGARGIAHLGVLKILVREKIPIDIVVGSSMGALVGGAFAAGRSVEELEDLLKKFLESSIYKKSDTYVLGQAYGEKPKGIGDRIQLFFKKNILLAQLLMRPGIIPDEEFAEFINFFVPDIDIQDTIIPFSPVATDLQTGERLCLQSGPLRKAVLASCALPGVITPVEWNGRHLADGGIILLVPTTCACELGAGFVVSVAVERDIATEEEFTNAVDIYVRAGDIQGFYLTNSVLQESDVVIRPDVGHIHWAEFHRGLELIKKGELAAEASLESIKKGLPKPRAPFTLDNILNSLLKRIKGEPKAEEKTLDRSLPAPIPET